MSTPVEPLTPNELERHIPAPEGAGLGALGTARGNLPLELIDLRAVVTGLATRIELVQGFRNPYPEALEATYIFPLPDRAAVTSLRMEAGDRIVEGVLKERGEARADYDQAMAEGRLASIAEQERGDVFTLRVGNIMPGERVRIRLSLAGLLPFEDGAATFRFPLVVAPRYIPGAPLPGAQVGDGVAPDTDAVPDASRITPPVLLPGFPNKVRLTARVEIDPAGLPDPRVRSSLHAVVEEGATDGLRVVRLEPGDRPDRDFVLRLHYGEKDVIGTSLAVRRDGTGGSEREGERGSRSGNEGTFALTLVPPAATGAARAKDVVLLLDRSGSMSGWKIVAARRAAARIIDSLGADDRFDVLTFDNEIERVAGAPAGFRQANDRNRFRAVEHLAAATARGGTEMLRPLREAVDLLAAEVRRAGGGASGGRGEGGAVRGGAGEGEGAAWDRRVGGGSGRDGGEGGARIGAGRGWGEGSGVGEGQGGDAGGGSGGGGDAGTGARGGGGGGAGRDRVLILVTDGQVGNEDQILRALASDLAGIRVHTVGVDTAVHEGFLRSLAALGGGRCELVESEDRLDEAMRAVHHRIAAPVVSGLRVVAGSGDGNGSGDDGELAVEEGTVCPQRLPDLFPGAPLVITGRVRGAAFGTGAGTGAGAGTVTVVGRSVDGTEWRQTVSARPADGADLAAIWARMRVRDLEDRYAAQSGRLPELEDEITATSLRFGVLSRFTAFVAIDQRVVNEGGEVHSVVQPVELPQGWEPAPPAGGRVFGGMPVAAASATGSVAAPMPGPVPPPPAPARPAAPQPMARPQLPGHARMARPHSTREKSYVSYMAAGERGESASVQRWGPWGDIPEPLRAFVVEMRLAWLRLSDSAFPERREFLSKLGAEITARISGYATDGHGPVEPWLRVLRELATEVSGAGDDPAAVHHSWLRVGDVFDAFAGEDGDKGERTARGRPGSREFWKR